MNKKSLLSLLLSSMLLVTYCSAVPVQADPSWSIRTVTNNARGVGSNGYCPIAVDSNNNPHIAYSKGYAYWNGSGWSTQTISPNFDDAFSLVLDANDNPYILYEAGKKIYDQGGLKTASWTGSNWSIQTVDEQGAGYGAIALDSYGNPHVVYVKGEEINYASMTGSNWNIQTIEISSDTFNMIDVGGLSLVLDSNNTPYVLYSIPSSYVDDSTGLDYQTINVRLAISKNSTWNIQTVPLPPPIGQISNIVLDSKDYPHFICSQNQYRNSEDRNLIYTLLYVSWDGTIWTTQTVASNIAAEDYAIPGVGFLSLDSSDFPHFVSFIASSSRFMYASWTGTDWNIQNVDTTFAHGPSYLAVGSNRIPHISYRSGGINDGTNRIMYATANESTLIITPSPTPTTQAPPTFSASPLPLALTAVIVGAVVAVVVYVWKKKTQSLSK